MQNEIRRTGRPRRSMPWLKAFALALPIILAACVISDSDEYSTSVVMCFNENGLSILIRLDHPVRIPLDREDAYYIMRSSGCPCQGPLSLVGDYWQYPEYPGADDCGIRINAYTGDVECFGG